MDDLGFFRGLLWALWYELIALAVIVEVMRWM
jgi:hypothetical protein